MNPWTPDTNPQQGRRIGKTNEEVNELGSVLARISIQGIDEIDPSSGKTNRQRMWEESADVVAQIECNQEFFKDFSQELFRKRVEAKKLQMAQWEAHFKTDRRIFGAETVAEQQTAMTRLMASDSCSICHGDSDRCDVKKCGGAHR